MSEPFVFDPRYHRCKQPFGAVVCGEAVTFHCRPLKSEGFTHCSLVMHEEFSGILEEYQMSYIGEEKDGRVCFATEVLAPKNPDLVWYYFRFWRDNHTGCVLDKTGYRSDLQLDPWQLTVYEKSHTPAWFSQGIIYQIFPDRFHRLSIPDPEGMVGDRAVHQGWNEEQVWKPDEKGIIRNNDFFGGSLAGITEKLDELAAMGVSILYLNPIFEAASNHRYNTADYSVIDPMLGTEEDFKTLCAEAKKRGIRVMLDGVFNHIGSQSRYFNNDGFYPELGAAQSKDSPYYNWFSFKHWPDDYESWWGINTLPAVREEHPDYVNYIIENEDAIIRRWLRCGASAWRLDVADELPDEFVHGIHMAARAEKPDAVVIGEVWEDGSNKISYNTRRKHVLGGHCDGLMNYPFRTALLDWLRGGNAANFRETMETLRENYPPFAYYSAMNALGTHDTLRVLTLLGAGDGGGMSRQEKAEYRLSGEQRRRGMERLMTGAAVLFCFPGSPTVYYGDEAGMEGFEDPFNRRTFPWGSEDRTLTKWFAALGKLRHKLPALRKGQIEYLSADERVLAFVRTLDKQRILCAANAGDAEGVLQLPAKGKVLLGDGTIRGNELTLPPRSASIVEL